jgi:hypothetical protein
LWLAAAPAFFLLAVSCRTVDAALEPPTGPVRYALVFVIHGDGSYLFHDENGEPRQADQVALERARATALANPEAEVFVFHQHTRRGLSRKNGTLELYRNAALVSRRDYRRGDSGMEPENTLYRNLSRLGHSADVRRIFLYFGHQVPERAQPGYNDSIPQAPFDVERLAGGIGGFLSPGNRFDLVVLSTCNNGTPTVVAALAPLARYLVASPADLHLSHLTTGTLHHLERSQPLDTGLLAGELALTAFRELAARVATIVTVSVYDMDTLAPRLAAAAADLKARLEAANGLPEFYDCGQDPRLSWLAGLPGVTIHYRPPRFGRERNKESHSGLECFR